MSSEDQIIHQWLATQEEKRAAVRRYITRIDEFRKAILNEKGLTKKDRDSYLQQLDTARQLVASLEKKLNGFINAIWNWNSVRKIQIPAIEVMLNDLEKSFSDASAATKFTIPIISHEAREAIERAVSLTQPQVQQPQVQSQVPTSLPPPPRLHGHVETTHITQKPMHLSGGAQASLVGSGIIGISESSLYSAPEHQSQYIAVESASTDEPETGYASPHRHIHTQNLSISSTNTFGYPKHSHHHGDKQALIHGLQYMSSSQQGEHNDNSSILSTSSSGYGTEEGQTPTHWTNQQGQQDHSEGRHRAGHSVNVSVSSSNTFGYPSNFDTEQEQTPQI
ncbi:hypothetical protein JR316_0008846 [Psilocybe cubensis]|uniref:Uncharacterized protein n=2 Tax=Psilocybe cubensis TaxID=181762 RepID=A0A8H8CK56_PSICU|nr:hypothetical protein JR316_0008846 [Psilocybe cubensis]KAH9478392.1 hypothetical protein JR316_0008846 [Psilocybe cubensis]